jgi:hypothetical protein
MEEFKHEDDNKIWVLLLRIKELDRNSAEKLDIFICEAKSRNYNDFHIYLYASEMGSSEQVFEYPELVKSLWEFSKLMWKGSPNLQVKMFDDGLAAMEAIRLERFEQNEGT